MDYERLFKRAKAFACRRGLECDSEDFAQEFCIQAFEHGKVRIDWVFADYLRENYGRTGTPGGDARAIGRARTVSLDAPINSSKEDSELLLSVVGDTQNSPDRELELRDLLRTLNPRTEREWFLVESTLAGYTNKQIADELGVTESRVSQLFKNILSGANDMELALNFAPPETRKWVAQCCRQQKR